MDRSRLRRFAAIGAVVAVIGAAVALAGPSIGIPPADPGTPGSCVDFARDVNPKEVAVDTGYDPEKNLVYAHSGGRGYVLEPGDPTCQSLSAVRAVMDDAIQTDRENEAVSCREIADALASGRTEERGRPFDRPAAQRYVDQRCGSVG